MKNSHSSKNGHALILSLVFAAILLQLAISYTGMLKSAHPQNILIDERVKMDFITQGLIEKSILKFQLFPADFYAANDATNVASYGPLVTSVYLNAFVNDPALSLINFTGANSSISSVTINVSIASMALLTRYRWNQEAIRIQALASYMSKSHGNVQKEQVRLIKINRIANHP